MADPLRHHGDLEAREAELDFAVNVYDGPRPPWLDAALVASLGEVGRYPDPTLARRAVAARHRRPEDGVLVTAGAAEAFTLIARLRPWRRPVVVHPQFTEPHAALVQAGHTVTPVVLPPPFLLDVDLIPDDADLVILGNPTNPTGVLHPVDEIRGLLRPGRVVVVDEAFMDCVPGEGPSLADVRLPGLVVIRSLTKHWGIPGIRAGYVVGDALVVTGLALNQTPWSVGATAAAAVIACSTPQASVESRRRAELIGRWREHLAAGLQDLGITSHPSAASFVLAQVGPGVHGQLRRAGLAVRRADTFPGLDDRWVRIAVRAPEQTDHLLAALRHARVR